MGQPGRDANAWGSRWVARRMHPGPSQAGRFGLGDREARQGLRQPAGCGAPWQTAGFSVPAEPGRAGPERRARARRSSPERASQRPGGLGPRISRATDRGSASSAVESGPGHAPFSETASVPAPVAAVLVAICSSLGRSRRRGHWSSTRPGRRRPARTSSMIPGHVRNSRDRSRDPMPAGDFVRARPQPGLAFPLPKPALLL